MYFTAIFIQFLKGAQTSAHTSKTLTNTRATLFLMIVQHLSLPTNGLVFQSSSFSKGHLTGVAARDGRGLPRCCSVGRGRPRCRSAGRGLPHRRSAGRERPSRSTTYLSGCSMLS